jgi:glycosyltransferase involved in cell wall biosynthesis
MLLNREMGLPYAVSVHGLDAYSVRQASGLPGEWCRRVSRFVFQSAQRVICISEHVREQVLSGAPNCRTAVVYNGVDPVRFSPPEIEPARPRIVSVGNLIPIKGHAALLRVMAVITPIYPTLECDLVGTGPELSRLGKLAADLQLADRVRFLGRRSRREVAELLQGATLFALPSTYEGLGCVYLEAMACGRAAIGCRGQGIEEVIQHGINGWLVGPDNVDELTHALSALLSDARRRKQIGSHARTAILQGFTLEHQAHHLLQVYRECVA